ncbi:hypothetical protein C7B63_19595 [Bacillus halotolerans]|nr:hypothetical protein C7B63_19595 [Bacillus halotolerans]PRP57202.1 hypothetical protein C7B66_19605 [Bacillus halotolerans]PRP61867.1 hypothetical protein C7B72_19605 [Bacillus halotolerans]
MAKKWIILFALMLSVLFTYTYSAYAAGITAITGIRLFFMLSFHRIDLAQDAIVLINYNQYNQGKCSANGIKTVKKAII